MHKVGLGGCAVAVDGDDRLTEEVLVARVLFGESQGPSQELLGVTIKQAVVVMPVLPVRRAGAGLLATVNAAYVALDHPPNRVALKEPT
jgi:hypothetical protein